LLSRGISVLGISRSPELDRVFLPYLWQEHKTGNFRFEQLDLNKDTDRTAECIGDFKPDYVVNFVAQGMVAESWLHPEHWYQTNIVANVRLHDQLRHFDFLKKYVHVSTPEVYGNCRGNMTEEAPFNPSTPYAASRAGCELHLRTFIKNYRFPVVFTRSANVFGPGQQLYRIIPRTILYILLGRKLPLHGGGHSVRSFIHIRDVADGTLRVAREGEIGEAYHFSTTRNISIRKVVEMICDLMGAKFEDVAEVVGDRPGIQDTIAWVRNNLQALQQQPLDYIHKP
jgi:dTDP-glucose 4,6-dehydratase